MITMKYIIAMIRPEKLDSVKKELQEIKVHGLTVSSVLGYGAQGGHLNIDRTETEKYEANLLDKIKIEIAVKDDFLDTAIEAIERGSRDIDGYIGSGKIFVLSLENVMRIRTKEVGNDAL
ncbi:MAG TPA: P-II family nitrogen regulator [Methanosarcina sp.]|jgi:nitrogen regulatory protein P-II 1